MAANSQSRGIASIGKRFISQISAGSRDSTRVSSPQASALRRGVHVSTYDKEIDEQVRPTVVPEGSIDPTSDKYWAPHPQTGVFGPSSEHISVAGAGGGNGFHSAPSNGETSVLEQKAWFRPQEDVEKPRQF